MNLALSSGLTQEFCTNE